VLHNSMGLVALHIMVMAIIRLHLTHNNYRMILRHPVQMSTASRQTPVRRTVPLIDSTSCASQKNTAMTEHTTMYSPAQSLRMDTTNHMACRMATISTVSKTPTAQLQRHHSKPPHHEFLSNLIQPTRHHHQPCRRSSRRRPAQTLRDRVG